MSANLLNVHPHELSVASLHPTGRKAGDGSQKANHVAASYLLWHISEQDYFSSERFAEDVGRFVHQQINHQQSSLFEQSSIFDFSEFLRNFPIFL